MFGQKCLGKYVVSSLKGETMKNETKIKANMCIRNTEETDKIISYLGEKLLLNPTSIVRLSLATLYEIEKNKENKA